MKEFFTKLLATVVFALVSIPMLIAQIPNNSPVPVDVFIDGDGGFSRQFDYSSVVDSDTWGIQPLRQTVSGEVAWARDNVDSLMCDGIATNDLTGKMAIVQRGACNFSLKIWNAQEAGAVGVIIIDHTYIADGGGLVNMAAGDSGLVATIPAIFITRDDGDLFIDKVNNGETVTATFQVRGFSGDLGPYAYGTPSDQILALDEIQSSFLNLDTANAITDVVGTVDITDPMGNVTTLMNTIDTIQPDSTGTFLFDDYVPSDLGTYSMVYTNNQTMDTLSRSFEITDYTFQMDNGNIPAWPADSWIANSYDGFVTDGLRYDFGNFYLSGSNGGVATHVTFSLGNPDSLFTGFADADQFNILVYDADSDGDGVGPSGAEVDYTEIGDVVGFGGYVLTGEETPYQLLTVELDDPITLKADGQYMVVVQYDGINAGLGIPPWYTYAGQEAYPYFGSVVFTDRLYMGGWSGDFHGVIRLHMDGFTPVSTFEPLDAAKVNVMPNPASDLINIQFDLEEIADEVQIGIMDFSGKLLRVEKYENVLDNTVEFDVSQYPAGSYFFTIQTPEGYRAKKFVVAR
jgi:hypothetical protein